MGPRWLDRGWSAAALHPHPAPDASMGPRWLDRGWLASPKPAPSSTSGFNGAAVVRPRMANCRQNRIVRAPGFNGAADF